MKILMLVPVLMYSLSPLLAKNVAMKEAQKEAEAEAKQSLSSLKKKIQGKEELGVSDQDLLPTADKGQKMDPKLAKHNFKQSKTLADQSQVQQFLSQTKKTERLDGNEDFLLKSQKITEHPKTHTEITSIKTKAVPEEEKLHVCKESGTYLVSFTQKLAVEVTPEEKKKTKRCEGHKKTKEYFWRSDAEKEEASQTKKLSNDKTIENYTIAIKKGGLFHDYVVQSSFQHRKNTKSCDQFVIKEKIVKKAEEKDAWTTDNCKYLSKIESNPSCKLLDTKIIEGSETRAIKKQSVFRDIWTRQLIFSCEPEENSPCTKLRERGGVLISKKCLKETDFGECEQWKKIYDLGKTAAYEKRHVSFKKEEIWGLNNEFESTYEKNTDLGPVLTTLSIFADLKNNLENGNSDFQDCMQIFEGEALKCQKSFIGGRVFDCCKTMEGLAVNIKLAQCSDQERCLSKNRSAGKCHFIGTQKKKLGTVTEHIFCCFPTKLARVVHEQGRKQLGMKWGKASKPKCQGFSLEELQRIDFANLDLTEVIEDIQMDKKAYERKIKTSVEPLQMQVKEKIEQKRLELSEKQTPARY